MKKTLVSLSLLALAMGFTSCSDDDKSQPAADAAGTYTGYSEMSFKYSATPMIALNQSVEVTKVTDNTVAVKYASQTLGTYTLTDAKVIDSTTGPVITGNGTSVMGMPGSASSSYECSLVAAINKKDVSVFEFTLPTVMGGTTTRVYTGELPEAKYKYVMAGSYKGYFTGTASYFPDGMKDTEEATVTVTADEDNEVNIEATSSTWGTFTCKGLVVSRVGNVFTVSGDGECQMGMNGNVKSYPCEVEASKDAETDAFDLKFTVPSVMGGLTVTLGK